jgi:hypothetical protein
LAFNGFPDPLGELHRRGHGQHAGDHYFLRAIARRREGGRPAAIFLEKFVSRSFL